MKDEKILVVGGRGYIGSHVVRMLVDQGSVPVVLDNLSGGAGCIVSGAQYVQGDAGDRHLVEGVLRAFDVSVAMHFASYIQVGESVQDPAKYYENNVVQTLQFLNALVSVGVKRFIFSSTAAVFGESGTAPIGEDHARAPTSPYGRSKYIVEQLLGDYERAYGLRSVCLRYFNAAGAHPDGSMGERHRPETHLIPLAIQAAVGLGAPLQLFGDDYPTGDGTCIRDYVHVMDLADAHIRAAHYLRAGGKSTMFNLGNAHGYSVRQVLNAVGEALGKPVPHQIVRRRPGDPAVLIADGSRARQMLGWVPQRPELSVIVRDAVRFHLADAHIAD